MARAVNRRLSFFHSLQQRGLGARRHAVDFVSQQDVSEYRSVAEREAVSGEIENVHADDICWHQIAGALHALKSELKQARIGLRDQRLGNARHAFQQRVTAAQQRE